ncbi:MAG TPA: hypothetical protein VGB64_12425 [Actinomycetota bacterium]
MATLAALLQLSHAAVAVADEMRANPHPNTRVISMSETGRPADGPSFDSVIAGSGTVVAFASRAANLSAGDDNDRADVFARDLTSGSLELISRSSGGEIGDDDSSLPSLSYDGRYIAFHSFASNLVPGFGWGSIYLHDRATGVKTPVTKGPHGHPADGVSGNPTVSGDGNYVVFYSRASNLVHADTNGVSDTFVYDVRSDIVERVSISTTGAQANGPSHPAWFHASISTDGRFVAYISSASNLVLGDDPGTWDAFIYDRHTQTTRRISERDGVRIAGSSRNVAISPDGTVAAIVQEWPAIRAEHIGIGVTNPNADILVVDLATSEVEVITNTEPAPGALYKDMVSLSRDGRYIAYTSRAPLQTAIDNKGSENVYLYDRELNETTLVNVSSQGVPALGGDSGVPSISGDGSLITFVSSSPTLTGSDRTACVVYGNPGLCSDVFLRDRGPIHCEDGRREEGSVSRMVAGLRTYAPRPVSERLQRHGCTLAGAGA